MLLIPAIDLREGHCVRLEQGLMEQATMFSDSPAEIASHRRNQDAHRLRLVNLNGTFAGVPQNFPTIKEILAAVAEDIPIQPDDGIHDLSIIEEHLNLGLTDVIIGTAAVKNPESVRGACREFPEQIIVGLDARDGIMAMDDWTTVTEHHVIDLTKCFKNDGVNSIIYAGVSHNDMMSGMNIKTAVELAQSMNIPIIASGGLTDLDNTHALCAVEKEGMSGAITGRTICEGSIDFVQVQKLTDPLA